MALNITVPRLGWTMEEGVFVGWLKKDGESVRAGEPLFTLDGDKAMQDVEATDHGVLSIPAHAPSPNSTVRVGDFLGYLLAEGERLPDEKNIASASTHSQPGAMPATAVPTPSASGEDTHHVWRTRGEGGTSKPAATVPNISPRALRAATERGVDWKEVQGTGRGGRIRERDVLAAAQSQDQPRTASQPQTPFSLANKVALVTGAASGIGAAIAEAFAKAGAVVIVADMNEAGATEQAGRLTALGGKATAASINVADQAACEGLIKRVLAEHGQCDVLVNNAGIGHVGTILTTGPEDLQRLWSVNVQGMYYLARAVLPAMIERRRGSIINLASVLGLTAMEDRFAYTVTKHAVVGLTRSMALDFGPTAVRINCICPGRVETPFVQARLAEYPDPEKFRVQMSASHAQKRMAQPWEIASAALYLASDESAFVTGSTLVIDGGYLCGK